MTSSVTTDFRHEYEAEQERWLRRRFLWYAGVVITLSALSFVVTAGFWLFAPSDNIVRSAQQSWWQLSVGIVPTLMYVVAFVHAYRTLLDRARMLRLVFQLIVASGLISLLSTPLIVEFSRDDIAKQINQERQGKVFQQVAPGGLKINYSSEVDSTTPPDPSSQPRPQNGSATPPPSTDTEGTDAAAPTSGLPPLTRQELDKRIAQMVVAGNALGNILLTHLFACLFLPWTWRESIRPMVPLLVASAAVNLWYVRLVPTPAILTIVLSPLAAVPGALICWWRQGRFKDKFYFQMLKGRYGEIKQELGYARQIHESLFPDSITDGPVRLDYRYDPMRQIGGDYLFCKRVVIPGRPLPVLHVAIVDVTGHGIGAALTVNRLHGEIERQFGENPGVSPGDILTGLNRYLHHTLASHSVYATALCLRLDPNEGTLAWASAGHPPAFLRAVDGTLDRLDSTTLVLGACLGSDFEHNEQVTRFGPGDTLIAYTDGAIECRNAAGRMLSVAGLERIVAGAPPDEVGGWASSVIRAVESYRFGPLQDDTLVVEIYRPVRVEPAVPRTAPAAVP